MQLKSLRDLQIWKFVSTEIGKKDYKDKLLKIAHIT